ncbi:MAG: hypothetical protein FWE70_03560 [Oscillospiraceae bacterium]|nr:hypothetical protein [Oscillospiraceae bacterium]
MVKRVSAKSLFLGIGLGIIITSIISVVYATGIYVMSPAEIRKAAGEMGMVFPDGGGVGDGAAERSGAGADTPGLGSDGDRTAEDASAGGAGTDAAVSADTDDGPTGSGTDGPTPGEGTPDPGEGTPGPGDGSFDGTDAGGMDPTPEAIETADAGEGPSADTDGAERTPSVSAEDAQTDGGGALVGDGAAETMLLVVLEGDISQTVAAKLAEMGAVGRPEDFSSAVVAMGLDDMIIYGEYEIPLGATVEDIIGIITRPR